MAKVNAKEGAGSWQGGEGRGFAPKSGGGKLPKTLPKGSSLGWSATGD